MYINNKNIEAHYFDEISALNSRSKSEYLQIENLEFNIIIKEDNYDLNQEYNKILNPYYEYVFSFNSPAALENTNLNQFNLIREEIIKHLVQGCNSKTKFQPLLDKPFLILSTINLDDNHLDNLSTYNKDYIFKTSTNDKIISKITLYTNSLNFFTRKKVNENIFENILTQINKNLSKQEFNVKTLSTKTNYSQRQLSRIITSKTNMTPAKFILELRLKKAHELLASNENITIKEIKYSIGINSSSYFSKKFKDRFGYTPSKFKRKDK